MAITKTNFYDLVVWTPTSMEIVKVEFNKQMWEEECYISDLFSDHRNMFLFWNS